MELSTPGASRGFFIGCFVYIVYFVQIVFFIQMKEGQPKADLL